MNLISLINTDMLFAKALEQQVPYFKFGSWIESTVQKEVISQLFKAKGKGEVPADLITSEQKPQTKTVQQKNQMKNQLIAFMNQAKNIKMPKMPKMPAMPGAKTKPTTARPQTAREETKQHKASLVEEKKTPAVATPTKKSFSRAAAGAMPVNTFAPMLAPTPTKKGK